MHSSRVTGYQRTCLIMGQTPNIYWVAHIVSMVFKRDYLSCERPDLFSNFVNIYYGETTGIETHT